MAKKGEVVALAIRRSSTGNVCAGVPSTSYIEFLLAEVASAKRDGDVVKVLYCGRPIKVDYIGRDTTVRHINGDNQLKARRLFNAKPNETYETVVDLQNAILAA